MGNFVIAEVMATTAVISPQAMRTKDDLQEPSLSPHFVFHRPAPLASHPIFVLDYFRLRKWTSLLPAGGWHWGATKA